jgi:hypothetical protein
VQASKKIDAAAAAVAKEQIDVQVQKLTPTITKALIESAATLNQANALMKRYRIMLYVAAFLLGLESAVLTIVLVHHYQTNHRGPNATSSSQTPRSEEGCK